MFELVPICLSVSAGGLVSCPQRSPEHPAWPGTQCAGGRLAILPISQALGVWKSHLLAPSHLLGALGEQQLTSVTRLVIEAPLGIPGKEAGPPRAATSVDDTQATRPVLQS